METKEKEQILKSRIEWYGFTPVLFEIVKCLKNRELCFLTLKTEKDKKPVRYLLAFSVDYLIKHFKRFDFFKYLNNIYHSTALLKSEVPVFSYNLKQRRKEEKYQDFNRDYANYVIGYNLFIDLDAEENWKEALEDLMQVKKIFDDYKVPYYILNSSFRGFHIVIPAQFMPEKKIDELLPEINEVVYNLKGTYDFKSIDTSIFDLKRVQKMPYSFSCDNSICLPLSDEQLAFFTPEIVRMENVLKNIHIKNRGLLLRRHNLSDEQLKKNVQVFIDDFLE